MTDQGSILARDAEQLGDVGGFGRERVGVRIAAPLAAPPIQHVTAMVPGEQLSHLEPVATGRDAAVHDDHRWTVAGHVIGHLRAIGCREMVGPRLLHCSSFLS